MGKKKQYSVCRSGCDYELAKVNALQTLREKIKSITEQPFEYMSYFQKKNNSIWNEPTFGTFYRNNIEFGSSLDRVGILYDAIINETGMVHKWIIRVLRTFQFLTYLGIVAYTFFCSSNNKIEKNLGMIAFVGAYIFFTFWEAKSEYIIIFYIMLIPYGIIGLGLLADGLKSKPNLIRQLNWKMYIQFILLILIIGLLCYKNNIVINDDYQEYLDTHTYLRQGRYNITSKVNDAIVLSNVYVNFDSTDFFVTIMDNDDRKYNKFLYWDVIDLSTEPVLATFGDNGVAMTKNDTLNDEDSAK